MVILMADTVETFRDELRALRVDLYSMGENIDTKLLASYVDRLIISLDNLAQNLDLMSVEVETLGEAEEMPAGEICPCTCCGEPMAKKKAPAKKKAAKKPMKKPAKKEGRR